MLSLKAKIRTQLGKKNKKLRDEDKLPGVLYGRKVESTPITLDYKDFDTVYQDAGESALVSLELVRDGASSENVVLIRDVVVHPLSRRFIHTDFYQVPMDEEITITIPMTFMGEAPAVKNEGAVLIRNVYDVNISALPKKLPREIVVDLSILEHMDDAISVKDLTMPEGVSIEAEEDLVIVSVTAPEEEVIEEEVEEGVVAPDEIMTEAEEKREEEATEESEAEPSEKSEENKNS